MKKILLLLTALFVMGGVEVSAKKTYAEFATPAGNGTWTSATNTYTWNASYNNLMTIFSFPNGELVEYTSIHLITSDYVTGPYRICFMNGGNKLSEIAFYSAGEKNLVLSERNETKNLDLSQVTHISFGGASGEGSIGIDPTTVYLEGPDYIEASIPSSETLLTKNMFKSWSSSEMGASVTSDSPYWDANEFGVEGGGGGVLYGSGNVYYLDYADLSRYHKMIVYGSGGYCRFLFNRITDGGSTTEISITPSEGGTEFDLSDFEYVHLNGIKVGWGGNATITGITLLSKTDVDYKLEGTLMGGSSLASALADKSAKVFDATGVIGTGIELTPANPNAIFIANAGTLSNTKNVQVGTTISNLEIADGYPLADLTGVTATAATYTRSMTNQFGTICLPYAVESSASVKYYTIDELSGDVLTLKEEETLAAGTPAIVEKVTGNAITATGSGALAAAGAPTGNLELIGTFEKKTVLAADYPGKNIYAISNNQFVQGLNSITVPAFRAYFTADTSAEANLRLGFGDEATAIEKLTGKNGVEVEAVYSVSGASQPALQKGINLVKFSDGSVKKVIVK